MHCNTNNPKHKKVSHSDCQTLLRKRQKLCCRRLSLFVVFPLSSLDVSPRIIAARRNRERDIHSGRDTNYDTFQFSSELRQKGNEALDTRQTQEEEKFNQLRRRVRRLSLFPDCVVRFVDGFESVLFLTHVHTPHALLQCRLHAQLYYSRSLLQRNSSGEYQNL